MRMCTVCERNRCNGCMACVDACPIRCITIADSVFEYNAIKDSEACINCGKCERICPNITKVDFRKPIAYYQGWASDFLRERGTSGGVASAIIRDFIKSGGYIAACHFRLGKFEFDLTNDISVVGEFAGSKYVKSNPIGIYRKICDKLKTNKVLFIGLPCQVAALKNFIKDHSNLYTVDLICHGSPSPILLKKALLDYNINIESVKSIKFRDKNDMGISIDGKRLINRRVTDDYTCAFLSSIDYTENCYSCQFAKTERVSDITLGDSWGTDLVNEEKNGVSLILVQTSKGKKLLEDSSLNLFDVNTEKAINTNHQLVHPSKKHPRRDKFIREIQIGNSFHAAVSKVIPKMIFKQKVKHLLCKLGIL